MIPYAREYTSTVTGKALKAVHCRECGTEYLYLVERSASGSGTSFLFLDNDGAASRAEHAARLAVSRLLEQAVEVIPCPTCGRVNPTMVAHARRTYRHGLYTAALVVAVLGAALSVPVAVLAATSNRGEFDVTTPLGMAAVALAGAAVLAVVALIARKWAAARYDPNDLNVEVRKATGRVLGMTRADFERMTAPPGEPPAPAPEPAPPQADGRWSRIPRRPRVT